MRKFFLLAFAALGLSVMAQHVTPLSIEIADPKIDSLRSLYVAEPMMYRASLETANYALEKNADEIKAAKAVLKVEQAHGKEMMNALKEAVKMTASLKKIYLKEEGELKSMQKVVERQQRTLNKQKELNQETRDNYLQLLEREQKELGYSLREVAERQRAISDLETSLQNSQSNIQSYIHETEQKAFELSNLEARLKERMARVKTEQKNAKSMK